MKFSSLVASLPISRSDANDPDVWSLSEDSRTMKQGGFFLARTGTRADGRAFVADAVSRGAVAVLAPAGSGRPADLPAEVAWCEAADPAIAGAFVAERFHGNP
ncbi:MAG: hypothetical protein RLZZ238_1522, partial [Planctomycetota bacterium]